MAIGYEHSPSLAIDRMGTSGRKCYAPILIFPNPLNPRRYVVLNSGIDFRNDAYGSNARQTPKLPDWSIINLGTPPGSRWPGRVVGARSQRLGWGL